MKMARFKKCKEKKQQNLKIVMKKKKATSRFKREHVLNEPKFKLPFKYGWTREVVERSVQLDKSDHEQNRKADVYYYSPENVKHRSGVDIEKTLKKLKTTELTKDNFTFIPILLGINNPQQEFIRRVDISKVNCIKISSYDQFKKPFTYGWKRVVVKSVDTESDSVTISEINSKKQNDNKNIKSIYYISPQGEKYLRMQDIPETCFNENLTKQNFTFLKQFVGINDPNKEYTQSIRVYRVKSSKIKFRRPSLKKPLKQKKGCLENEKFLAPFKYGWKRVLIRDKPKFNIRLEINNVDSLKEEKIKRVYYISPDGKNIYNHRELTELSLDQNLDANNFTFVKTPVGIKDTQKEFNCYTHLKIESESDVTNPEFKEPFKYNWKRVVIKNSNNDTIQKVYYISPTGKIINNYPQLCEISFKKLSVKNFTFAKKIIGIPNAEKEIIITTDTNLPVNNLPTLRSNILNTAWQEPFKHGWKRVILKVKRKRRKEVINRVYYLSPEGHKTTSYNQISKYLNENLTLKNFTFIKKAIGINTDKEIIVYPYQPVTKALPFVDVNNSNQNNKVITVKNEPKEAYEKTLIANYSFRNCVDLNLQENTDFDQNDLDPLSSFDNFEDSVSREFSPISDMLETKYSNQLLLSLNENCDQDDQPQFSGSQNSTRLEGFHSIRNQVRFIHNTMAQKKQTFVESSMNVFKIYQKVFQYLNFEDLVKVQQVCKAWKCFANDNSFYKKVTIDNFIIKDWYAFIDFLNKYNTTHLNLKKMKFKKNCNLHNTWVHFLSAIVKLRTLTDLELCRCPVYVIDAIIETCPQLQILTLSECDITAFKGLEKHNYSSNVIHEVKLNLKLGIIEIKDKRS